MLIKFKLWLRNPAENLWVQPTLGALFSLLFSFLAGISNRVLPEDWVVDIKPDTLLDLLEIISGSMLAVTTFSLSIMVSALAAASNNTTPRARLLVMNDKSARLAITSFISAFIYSVIAKITLGLKYYGASGRFVMFVGTLLVLIYLIFTLIRWVHTLSNLGSLGDTLKKIEKVARESLARYRQHPNLGIEGKKPNGEPAFRALSAETGFLVNLDLKKLNRWAENHHCHIHIAKRINQYIAKNEPLFHFYPSSECTFTKDEWQEKTKDLLAHAVIQSYKAPYQDPIYGLTVLSEVGHNAMAPSVNDTATAKRAVSLMTRLLIDTEAADEDLDVYEHLSIHLASVDELAHAYFALARDGAHNPEFIIHLLKCLSMLHRYAPEAALRGAAEKTAHHVYQLACDEVAHQLDKQAIDDVWATQFKRTN